MTQPSDLGVEVVDLDKPLASRFSPTLVTLESDLVAEKVNAGGDTV